MLRYSQPFLYTGAPRVTKKNTSNHKIRLHPAKEFRFEPLPESEEDFFLTLQSRLPVLTIT